MASEASLADIKTPIDGTIDFRKFGRDIKKCGYNGTLTLEIGKNQSIPWYRVDTIEEEYGTMERFFRKDLYLTQKSVDDLREKYLL